MTWLALCTNLGVEDSLGQGHLFRYRVVVFSERAQSDVLRGVDVSMMWRGSKPQQAMGSNNHQGRDYRRRLRCPVCQLHLSQTRMHAS